MATPTWPDGLRPTEMTWRLVSNTASFTSPFTRQTQTQERPGARWAATLTFSDWKRDEIQQFEAFLASLRGSAGRFRLWNFARETPLGSNLGTPRVSNKQNLFEWSESLDNAYWTKVRVSVTADAAAAPDGMTAADKLVEDTSASNTHMIDQIMALSDQTQYTASIHAKAGERTHLSIWMADTGWAASAQSVFDLSAGTITSNANDDATITSIGNGWYRVTATQTTVTGGTRRVRFMLSNGTTAVYTGDGASGLYLWGAQINTGDVARPYEHVMTPSIDEAQTGATLRTDHWTPNEAGILLPGDYIEVGGELKMVTSQADSDELGFSAFGIEPPLRNAPADRSAITTIKPTALFMLADDEQTAFEYSRSLGGFSIDIMEAF